MLAEGMEWTTLDSLRSMDDGAMDGDGGFQRSFAFGRSIRSFASNGTCCQMLFVDFVNDASAHDVNLSSQVGLLILVKDATRVCVAVLLFDAASLGRPRASYWPSAVAYSAVSRSSWVSAASGVAAEERVSV